MPLLTKNHFDWPGKWRWCQNAFSTASKFNQLEFDLFNSTQVYSISSRRFKLIIVEKDSLGCHQSESLTYVIMNNCYFDHRFDFNFQDCWNFYPVIFCAAPLDTVYSSLFLVLSPRFDSTIWCCILERLTGATTVILNGFKFWTVSIRSRCKLCVSYYWCANRCFQ